MPEAVVPLAENWWFWVLVAAALAAGFTFSGRYRALAATARRGAVRRGLVALRPGQALRRPSGGFPDDLSWLMFPAGAWVVVGPWTWGYDGADGAIATDVVTGALVIVIALAAIVFPALWTLEMVAGLWLVLAPWLVGYGDANGAVGLSDMVAGVLIFTLAIAALSAAQRALRPSPGAGAIGRLRRPRE
jgi:SPW repeat-containing protein